MDYSASYSYSSNLTWPALYAYIAFMSIFSIVMIVSFWKVFTKAWEQWWKSLIPLYNLIVLLQIAWKKPVSLLLIFVPIGNIIWIFDTYIKLAKKFGKWTWFWVGLVFLNPIFLLILAFWDAKYEKISEDKKEEWK